MKRADNERQRRRGMALVITLAFLVVITILVVGLATLMSVERPAASSNFEKRRAALLAQKGVDVVVGTLNEYTGNPNRYWISQPGQLVVSSGTAGNNALTIPPIPLYSGSTAVASNSSAYTGTNAVLRPPDLNMIDLSGTSHLISNDVDASGSPITMPVAWIYVHQDGVESTSDPVTGQPVANDSSSPIVGRYAYWADDESSKINYNMAWGRQSDPTYPVSNQAWAGDQTDINLTALQDSAVSVTPSLASAIHTFIVPDAITGPDPLWNSVRTFFNTPKEAQGIGGGASAVLDHFKSDVTNYNHDPDTTFFNQPRIVLTSRPDRAGWTWNGTAWVGKNGQSGPPDPNGNLTPNSGTPPYLEMLNNEGTTNGLAAVPVLSGTDPRDPGNIAGNINQTKLQSTINLLMNYLQRSDWPMLGSSGTANSFQAKYYTTGGNAVAYSGTNRTLRLVQQAFNIIDYVRSKESPDAMLVPLRGWTNATSGTNLTLNTINSGSGAVNSYFGVTRGPYVTQIAYWHPETNGTGNNYYVRFEVYNPANYNIPSVNPSQLSLSIESYYTNQRVLGTQAGVGQTLSGGPIPPGYCESFTILLPNPSFLYESGTANQIWRFYLGTSGVNENYDMAAQNEYFNTNNPPSSSSYYLTVPVDQYTVLTSSNTLTSIECDDPRCNAYCTSGSVSGTTATPPGYDWNIHPPSSNNFPLQDGTAVPMIRSYPYCTVGHAPNPKDFPPQDTGTDGMITDASFYMPPPAGTPATANSPGNLYGAVTSVGELGYICTGIESNPAPVNSGTSVPPPNPPPTPWRSYSLQPNAAGSGVVPDWALMDLFTAPTLITGSASAVYQPHPSDSAVGGRININSQMVPFNINRVRPLTALLQGAFTLTSGTTIVNPLSATAATQIANNVYNGIVAKSGTLYNYPNAYISQGEICEIKGVADSGEQSEELVREITGLTTARTGVFTIYTVGQALKQAPNGRLTVTGEQRTQAMVERVSTTIGNNPAIVDFRPVYYRNLTP